MKVYLNRISGIDDAIVSMFMSKRAWKKELEEDVRITCSRIIDPNGKIYDTVSEDDYVKFSEWMDKLTKWGKRHITMLRFINLSITVEGLHRGGQDDWDSHAMRYDNRIIRSSTRLSKFGYELSDFYQGKILPTDLALEKLGIAIPDTFNDGEKTWVKSVNGYIVEGMEDDKDVQRGLYMLSIPSDFIFNVNLTEWAHVYKERNKNSSANPEVKECAEAIADALEKEIRWFDRKLFLDIKN